MQGVTAHLILRTCERLVQLGRQSQGPVFRIRCPTGFGLRLAPLGCRLGCWLGLRLLLLLVLCSSGGGAKANVCMGVQQPKTVPHCTQQLCELTTNATRTTQAKVRQRRQGGSNHTMTWCIASKPGRISRKCPPASSPSVLFLDTMPGGRLPSCGSTCETWLTK